MQEGPRGIGVAYREGISYARGTHILCMDSDGEMELSAVTRLRDAFRADDALAVAVASRWARGGGFVGYDRIKLSLNWAFQRLVRILYRTRICDLTYGFKMFRADLVQRLPFTGVRHEFACEGTLLPIRLGLPVAETHSRWVRRKTGRSSNAFIDNLRYVGMALRIRCGTYELLALPVQVEPKILDPSDTSAVGRDNQR
jgi:dolichol-phosphate mannosyltransferase